MTITLPLELVYRILAELLDNGDKEGLMPVIEATVKEQTRKPWNSVDNVYGENPPPWLTAVPGEDTITVRYTYPDGNTYSDTIRLEPEDYSTEKKVLGVLSDLPSGWAWKVHPIKNGVVECVAVQKP